MTLNVNELICLNWTHLWAFTFIQPRIHHLLSWKRMQTSKICNLFHNADVFLFCFFWQSAIMPVGKNEWTASYFLFFELLQICWLDFDTVKTGNTYNRSSRFVIFWWVFSVAVVFAATRMDKDSSMTVDWDEFLHYIILNPVDRIGELVSSWKHSLVRSLNMNILKHHRGAGWNESLRWSPFRCLTWARVVRCPSSFQRRLPVLVPGGRLSWQQGWQTLYPGRWQHP